MFTLARQRHRLRRSRDLPHDALDNLVDLLMEQCSEHDHTHLVLLAGAGDEFADYATPRR